MSMGTDTPLGNPLFARVDASSGSGARVVNILPFPHREGAARGDRRGKVVSVYRTRALAELAAKAFGGKSPPEIVEIATFA